MNYMSTYGIILRNVNHMTTYEPILCDINHMTVYETILFIINSYVDIWSHIGQSLDSHPGVPSSKPLGGLKIDSAFHPSEADKMNTRNFWELSGKK